MDIYNNRIVTNTNRYYFCLMYSILCRFVYLDFKKHIKDYHKIHFDEYMIGLTDDIHYKLYNKYIENGLIGEDVNGNKSLFIFFKCFKKTNDERIIESIINFIVHNEKWVNINKIYIIYKKCYIKENTLNEIDEFSEFIDIIYEEDLMVKYIDGRNEYCQRIKNIKYDQMINSIKIY